MPREPVPLRVLDTMPKNKKENQKAPTRVLRNAKSTEEKPREPAESVTLLGGEDIRTLVPPLLAWYCKNRRPLPWRGTGDPYHIWLSEVMLQQTRVEAVRPYFARFLAAAPTVEALAALPEDRLLKLWEGLGYYSRARNLHRAAKILVGEHGGKMPRDPVAIRALPGIGEYTAGAIASIAFGFPTPAVDGNVLRVFARLTHDEGDVLLPDTKRRMTALLRLVYLSLPKEGEDTSSECATLTQALMELGQVVCLPNRTPLCEQCPLSALCRACADGSHAYIPLRGAKKERRVEERLILLLCDGEGRYAIRRRPAQGLLGGLWELPSLLLPENEPSVDVEELTHRFCAAHGLTPAESMTLPDARHLFTHIEWRMHGVFLNVKREIHDTRVPTFDQNSGAFEGEMLSFVTPAELFADYALPSAFRDYLAYIT